MERNRVQCGIEEHRGQWVENQLLHWSQRQAIHRERAAWGWHPLFVLCAESRFVLDRLPFMPWAHTWEETAAVIQSLKTH
jgi:hypothetical protein